MKADAFPFIQEILNVKPTEVLVKRADDGFLNHVPLVSSETREDIHFVLDNGAIVHCAVDQGCNGRYGESVLHAVKRHGVRGSIEYFVTVNTDCNYKNVVVTVYRAQRARISALITEMEVEK